MTTPIIHPKPTTKQQPKLPDQIADAWAAVLIGIYQRLKQREDARISQQTALGSL